jgi:thymidine kinase
MALEIIIGPMFSGKSTELLRRLNIYAAMNLHVLYINSSFDDRATTMWSTHNPTMKSIGNIAAVKIQDLTELETEIEFRRGEEVNKAPLSSFDVIGIDEAQFFTGLKDFTLGQVEKLHKKVLIAGLNSDFKRAKFGEILDLIPVCDTIDKLTPFCKMCWENSNEHVNALFSMRINSENDSVIDVGDSGKYAPVCRKCYLENTT